jgi:Na+/phosphate symporter
LIKNFERREGMEKMFSSTMAGFMKGMSEHDKKRILKCGEEIAAMCSGIRRKGMSEEEKKAMMEKMMSFCNGKMEKMSDFFKKMCSQADKTGTSTT